MLKTYIFLLIIMLIGLPSGMNAIATAQTAPDINLVTTIPIGSGAVSPMNIAIVPNTNRIYIANRDSNNFSIIDGENNSVISTLPAGQRSLAIGANPNTNRIYVANFNSNDISVVDGATSTIIDTIPVGTSPARVEVNPNNNLIYVANFGSNNVTVIDGNTNTVVATVPVGGSPEGVAVNPNTNQIYIANRATGNVTVIDGATNQVITTLMVGSGPIAADVNPRTNTIYIANFFSSDVTVIDGNTNRVTTTIPTAGAGGGVAVNTNTNHIFVANFSADSVSVIDGATNRIITTMPVGGGPFGVRVNHNTNRIYIANINSGTVSVMSEAGPVTPDNRDFRLSISPANQTVTAGSATSFNISMEGLNGFSQPVNLTATVTPTNESLNFSLSSNTISAGNSSTLTVNTLANLPVGNFNINITGVSGSITRTVTATVDVTAQPVTPDFSLSFDAPQITVKRSSRGQFNININRVGGFADNVTVTPDAATLKAIKVKIGQTSLSTTGNRLSFDFTAKKKARRGSRELIFTATDNQGRARTARLTLVIE